MKKINAFLIIVFVLVSFSLYGQNGSLPDYYANLDRQSDNLSLGRTRFDVPLIDIPFGGKSIPITLSYTNVAPKYGILPGLVGHSWNLSFNYFVETKYLTVEPLNKNYGTAVEIYDDFDREGYEMKKINLPYGAPSLLYGFDKPSYWIHPFPDEFDFFPKPITPYGDIEYVIDTEGWKYYISSQSSKNIYEDRGKTSYIDMIVAPNKDTLFIEYDRSTLNNPFKRLEKTIHEPLHAILYDTEYGTTYTDTVDFPDKTVIYPTRISTSDGFTVDMNYTVTTDKVLLSGVSSSTDRNISINYTSDQYATLINNVYASDIENYQFEYEMPPNGSGLFVDCFNNYITGRSYYQDGDFQNITMLNALPLIQDFSYVDTVSIAGYPNQDPHVLDYIYSSYLKIEGNIHPEKILLSGRVIGGDIPAYDPIFDIGSAFNPTFITVPFQDYIADEEGFLTIGTRYLIIATLPVSPGISIEFKSTNLDQSLVRTKILQYFSLIKSQGMEKGHHLMGTYDLEDKIYFTFFPSKDVNDPTYFMLKKTLLPTGGTISYSYEPYEVSTGLMGGNAWLDVGGQTIGPDYRIREKLYLDLNGDTLSMLRYSYGKVQQFPFDARDSLSYEKNIMGRYIQESYHIYPNYEPVWTNYIPYRYNLSRSFKVTNVPVYPDEEEEYVYGQGFYHHDVTVEQLDTKGIIGKQVYYFDIPSTILRDRNSIINYSYKVLGMEESFNRIDYPQWLSEITLGPETRLKKQESYTYLNGVYWPAAKKEYMYETHTTSINRNILNWQFNGTRLEDSGLPNSRIISDCGLNYNSGWELEASKTRLKYKSEVLTSIITTNYHHNQ